MRQPKYVVELSAEEQETLEKLIRKGKSSASKQTRARILLKANEGMPVQDIMKALDASEDMVYRGHGSVSLKRGWTRRLMIARDRGKRPG